MLDYVLLGDEMAYHWLGRSKKTLARAPQNGKTRAQLYADAFRKNALGRRPVMYYSTWDMRFIVGYDQFIKL